MGEKAFRQGWKSNISIALSAIGVWAVVVGLKVVLSIGRSVGIAKEKNMNPETQEKMNELLVWMMETVKSGSDFVISQAPDVAQQMIVWAQWQSIVLCGISVSFLSLLLYFLFFKTIPLAKKGHLELDEDKFLPGIILSVILSIVCVILLGSTICNLLPGIQATVAPKVYILERLMAMKN